MLAIAEEFLSYQGEGAMTGTKMYFIRLQGCSVGCHFCDTKFTWKQEDQITPEIDITNRAVQSGADWICITGGEPLEQDIQMLIDLAHIEGLNVQIETSGVVRDKFVPHSIDHITLSPKTLFSKKKINRKIIRMCKEIKCVVTCATDVDYYLNEYQNVKKSNGMKFFAPVDNNPEIAQMILNKANNQWRISCQTQKILNLR